MITNYLSPTSFQVTVGRMPNVEFFVQRANIPALTMNPVSLSSPLNNYFQTPDRISYSDFDLSFVIDENMDNYLEIIAWMEGLGTPQTSDQYKDLEASDDGTVSDITLVIHNSHKNPGHRVVYKNAFPISISSVALNIVQQDIVYPEVTVTFRYDDFTVEKI